MPNVNIFTLNIRDVRNLLILEYLPVRSHMTFSFWDMVSKALFVQRKITSKEAERITQSVAMIRTITYLPVAYSMKKRIIAAAPMAKAEFSWLVKVLLLAVCKRVQKSIKIAVLT